VSQAYKDNWNLIFAKEEKSDKLPFSRRAAASGLAAGGTRFAPSMPRQAAALEGPGFFEIGMA